MPKAKIAVEEEVEVNMTPMLDIVFIMLIFFIVTAVFVKEPGVDVDHSPAHTAKHVKRVSTIIAVTHESDIWIDNKKVSVSDVRYIVSKFKQENPRGKVVIRADKNSQSGVVVTIAEQLNNIGIAGVSISARKGGAE